MRVAPFEHDPEPSDLISVWPEMVTSPLRVAKPSVRRGWLRRDDGVERGEDTFVEVGWDEALDMAAGEIGRLRGEFGNASLFAGSYGWSSAGRLHHARTLVRRFFNSIGGFTDQVTNYSYGAAMAFLPRILGVPDAVGSATTSFETIRDHTDIMLAFGGIPKKNWEVLSGGFGQHRFRDFMQDVTSSVRVLNISPFKGDIAAGYAAEWLPIRPNTDTALLLALAYEIILARKHAQPFLDSHCEGFGRYRRLSIREVGRDREDAGMGFPNHWHSRRKDP